LAECPAVRPTALFDYQTSDVAVPIQPWEAEGARFETVKHWIERGDAADTEKWAEVIKFAGTRTD
jgi:hypothetical protein